MATRIAAITWIVRYVEDGTLKVRSFQTEEAAAQFIERTPDTRSWAEVRTYERHLPKSRSKQR